MPIDEYYSKIRNAKTPKEVDDIVLIASRDDTITNLEYCRIYEVAVALWWKLASA